MFRSKDLPPAHWVWPYEGERLEVEAEVAEGVNKWVTAQVVVVLTDGLFQARIDAPEPFEDWFKWREEGTDWRRPPESRAGKAKRAKWRRQ